MRILAVRHDSFGCGNYRITHPMIALQKLGHEVVITQVGEHIAVNSGQLAWADAIILQRVEDPGWMDLVRSIPEEYRPAVAYEVDDLTTALDACNPGYAAHRQAKPRVEGCMVCADALFVTTPRLGAELADLNPRHYVLPNAIDFGVRDWEKTEPRQTHRLTIGWAGSDHHIGDVDVCSRAVRDVLSRRSEVAFAFCGHPDLAREWRKALCPRDSQWIEVPPASFQEYPGRLTHFDIGIAPVQPTRFGQCKSALKLLEYGAHGIPYVASFIDPYLRLHEESLEVGGFVAEGKKDWKDALDTLIEEAATEDFQTRRMRWYSYVRDNCTLEQAGLLWQAALVDLTRDRRRSRPYEHTL